MKKQYGVFGFEDYDNLYTLDFRAISNRPAGYSFSLFHSYIKAFIPYDNTEHIKFNKGCYWQNLDSIPNNKDILKNAKKLYLYSDCGISRSLVSTKYKICRNAAEADAIVVPNKIDCNINIRNIAIFANDKQKTIVMIECNSDEEPEFHSIFDTMEEGFPFKSIRRVNEVDIPEHYLNGLVFVCANEFVQLHAPLKSMPCIFDYITGILPTEKTVYENEVQRTLGNENNEITLEALKSIHDMLESTDSNTRAAALKSLAMMDYAKYPNSIKMLLSYSGYKIYSYDIVNTRNSVPVKYMLKYLDNPHRGWAKYTKNIGLDDFRMYKDLYAYIHNINNEEVNDKIKYLDFMIVDALGNLVPKLIEE